MPNVDQIAQEADIIVNGFAFKKNENEIKVFDLNNEVGREISKIQAFIKINYQDMYNKWAEYSKQGFYNK